MQIKIINIPLTDAGALQAELNRFLAGHKVLEMEQKFFQNEKGGCWDQDVYQRHILSLLAFAGHADTYNLRDKIINKIDLSM